jgi:hypothetical protein
MERWKIWITYYDADGRIVGYGVHTRDYVLKQSAVKRARQLFGDSNFATWIVSQDRPWTFPENV